MRECHCSAQGLAQKSVNVSGRQWGCQYSHMKNPGPPGCEACFCNLLSDLRLVSYPHQDLASPGVKRDSITSSMAQDGLVISVVVMLPMG